MKQCEKVGCEKNVWYNFSGWPKRFCKAHVLEGMVRMLAQVHRYLDVWC